MTGKIAKNNDLIKNAIQKIKENWVFIILFITSLLAFKIYYFYLLFNIDIFNFINLTEVISLSIEFLSTIFMGIIFIVLTLSFDHKWLKIIISLLCLTIIIIVFILLLEIMSLYDFLGVFQYLGAIILILSLILKDGFRNIKDVVLVSTVILFTSITVYDEISRDIIIKSKNSKEISFEYLNSNIVIGTNEVLIGHTNNYIFTYSKIDSTTKIYSMGDVKNLQIKRIR
jgi:hypothetical protein